MGVLWREILTESLLLATDFFVHYLTIFRAKDISAARNRRKNESFGSETILLVSSYTGYYRIVYENTQAPPSNKPGTLFKAIMAAGRLFRVIA